MIFLISCPKLLTNIGEKFSLGICMIGCGGGDNSLVSADGEQAGLRFSVQLGQTFTPSIKLNDEW